MCVTAPPRPPGDPDKGGSASLLIKQYGIHSCIVQGERVQGERVQGERVQGERVQGERV